MARAAKAIPAVPSESKSSTPWSRRNRRTRRCGAIFDLGPLDGQEAPEPGEVGRGDKQLEGASPWDQAVPICLVGHAAERLVQPPRHATAMEGRPQPEGARRDPQPEEWAPEPQVRAPGRWRDEAWEAQELVEVGVGEPDVTQVVCVWLRATALASTTPLIPPAEVPLITSTTTLVRTPLSRRRSCSACQYVRSVSSGRNGLSFRSGSASSFADAFTRLWISRVTPCM